ncbi:hypothetical protein DPMN_155631 [Dreissena polymorpha]|uniref:Uncharacterized protein n=1 Tax=Dreissena polymorpha TaxID=45954 RepID=A0A9D4J6T6_DREPO|nr:hypothetical protein DPMN_155631 [Dreissena polymorpha]
MQLLVQSQRPDWLINQEDLLKYSLTTVPFSIGTADGFLAKTDKSKGLKHVTEGTDHAASPKDKTLVIEDGNALFHSMKDNLSNFKHISEKLFNMTPKKTDVIFSTDMCKQGSVNCQSNGKETSRVWRKTSGERRKHQITGRLDEFPHKGREKETTCEDHVLVMGER